MSKLYLAGEGGDAKDTKWIPEGDAA